MYFIGVLKSKQLNSLSFASMHSQLLAILLCMGNMMDETLKNQSYSIFYVRD